MLEEYLMLIIVHLLKLEPAVECIHAYSLIHDDLPCMDNDTNEKRKAPQHMLSLDEATAILAGNSLLTLAFEILSDKKLNIIDKMKS